MFEKKRKLQDLRKDVYTNDRSRLEEDDEKPVRVSRSNVDTDPDGTHDVAHVSRSVFRNSHHSDDVSNDKTVEQQERLVKATQSVPLEELQQHVLGTTNVEAALNRRRLLNLSDQQDVAKERLAAAAFHEAYEARRERASTRAVFKDAKKSNVNVSRNMHLASLSKQKRNLFLRRENKLVQAASHAQLARIEDKRLSAAVRAVQGIHVLQDHTVGVLEAENDVESTMNVTQAQIKQQLLQSSDDGIETARNIYNLQLSPAFGPYGAHYDRSGRYLGLFSTRSGHVAVMDSLQQTLVMEMQLSAGASATATQENIYDMTFLHNHTLAAVAQKNHVYIYDTTTLSGAEVHCLEKHVKPRALSFLPYHWLLASIGQAGILNYQDTSTGKVLSKHFTKLGPCNVLRQNMSNGVIHAGHQNGTVTLWSPSTKDYLVKMMCHKGCAVTALAIDSAGHTMVSAGTDRRIRIWDLRIFKEHLFSYRTHNRTPATSLDISQRNLLAAGHAGYVTIWNADALKTEVQNPYMQHHVHSMLNSVRNGPNDHAKRGGSLAHTVRFRPFEDVCAIGHSRGVSSIVVPGSGEPTIDTYEPNLNPYQDTKQRREDEVRALLDKLSPYTIAIDPNYVGTIDHGTVREDPHVRLERLLQQKNPLLQSQTLDESMNDQDAIDSDAQPDTLKRKKKQGRRRGKSKTQTQLSRQKHEKSNKLSQKIDIQNQYKEAVNAVFSVPTLTRAPTQGIQYKPKGNKTQLLHQEADNDDNQSNDGDDDKKKKYAASIITYNNKHASQDTDTRETTIQAISEIKNMAPPALKRFF